MKITKKLAFITSLAGVVASTSALGGILSTTTTTTNISTTKTSSNHQSLAPSANSQFYHSDKSAFKDSDEYLDKLYKKSEFKALLSDPNSYAHLNEASTIGIRFDITNLSAMLVSVDFVDLGKLINPSFKPTITYQGVEYAFNTLKFTNNLSSQKTIPAMGDVKAYWHNFYFGGHRLGNNPFAHQPVRSITLINNEIDTQALLTPSLQYIAFDFDDYMFDGNNNIEEFNLIFDFNNAHLAKDLVVNLYDCFANRAYNFKNFNLIQTGNAYGWNAKNQKFILNCSDNQADFSFFDTNHPDRGNPYFDINATYLNTDQEEYRGSVVMNYATAEQIPADGYYGCKNLNFDYITFANNSNLVRVGIGAFGYCENMRNITLPDSITAIYYKAFANCSNLESVVLPSKLTLMNHQVFHNCKQLKYIKFPFVATSATIYDDLPSFSSDNFDFDRDKEHPDEKIARYWIMSNLGSDAYFLHKQDWLHALQAKYNEGGWTTYNNWTFSFDWDISYLHDIEQVSLTQWKLDFIVGDAYHNPDIFDQTSFEWNGLPAQFEHDYQWNKKGAVWFLTDYINATDLVNIPSGDKNLELVIKVPSAYSRITFPSQTMHVPVYTTTFEVKRNDLNKDPSLKHVMYDGILTPNDTYDTEIVVDEACFNVYHSDPEYIKTHMNEFIDTIDTKISKSITWYYEKEGDYYVNPHYGSFYLTGWEYDPTHGQYHFVINFSSEHMKDQTVLKDVVLKSHFKYSSSPEVNDWIWKTVELKHVNPNLTTFKVAFNDTTVDTLNGVSGFQHLGVEGSIPFKQGEKTFYYNTYTWMALNDQTVFLKENSRFTTTPIQFTLINDLANVNEAYQFDIQMDCYWPSIKDIEYTISFLDIASTSDKAIISSLPSFRVNVLKQEPKMIVNQTSSSHPNLVIRDIEDYVSYDISIPISLFNQKINHPWAELSEMINATLGHKTLTLNQSVYNENQIVLIPDGNYAFSLIITNKVNNDNNPAYLNLNMTIKGTGDLTAVEQENLMINFDNALSDPFVVKYGGFVAQLFPWYGSLLIVLGLIGLSALGFGFYQLIVNKAKHKTKKVRKNKVKTTKK